MKKENIVDDYYNNGYVVIDDVISDNQNKNILKELNKFNKNEFHNISNENKFLNKNNFNGFMYIGQPHVKSKIIYKQIFNKKIIKTLTQILGLNIPFWDGGIKFVQSMLVNKVPNGNGSPWHQDEYPIPTRDRSLTGVWISLEKSTIQNGCLWIIPNSHQSGILYKRYKHNIPNVDSMEIARGFDDSKQIPIETPKNSAIFFSGYLLHSSKKNVSQNNRPALTLHYCSSSTYLTWQGVQNYRGIIPVVGDDPYAFEGYSTPEMWFKEY